MQKAMQDFLMKAQARGGSGAETSYIYEDYPRSMGPPSVASYNTWMQQHYDRLDARRRKLQ